MYIFVRKDLSPAQICVQTGHACYSAAKFCNSSLNHPHFVLFGVKNEKELQKALKYTESSNILTAPFYEADKNNELTAFATEPVFESQRLIFKRFHCLQDKDLWKISN